MKKMTINKVEEGKFELVTLEEIEGSEPVEAEKFAYTVPKNPTLKNRAEALEFIKHTDETIGTLAKKWTIAGELDNSADTADKIFEHIETLAGLYNEASSFEAMRDCLEHEKPLLWACTRMIYPTMGVRLKEDKKLNVITLEIKRRDRRIALDKLHKAAEGIGEDKNWIYTAQAVNKIFTARLITELNGSKGADALAAIDGSYHMSEIAKQIKMGQNPVSNTKTLDQLRLCIKQMIGEEFVSKLISFDVKFLTSQYAKESKGDSYGLTLEAAAHKRFYDLLMRVCHHLITDKPYNVVFKEKK